MGLLVSNCANPCQCGPAVSVCVTVPYSEIITNNGNPYVEKHYPSTPINQYNCCQNLWFIFCSDRGYGAPNIDVSYSFFGDPGTIYSYTYSVHWGDGSEQETVYSQSGNFAANPGDNSVAILLGGTWELLSNNVWKWTCPASVPAKSATNVYHYLSIPGFNGRFWPIQGTNSGVIFPQTNFYSCKPALKSEDFY